MQPWRRYGASAMLTTGSRVGPSMPNTRRSDPETSHEASRRSAQTAPLVKQRVLTILADWRARIERLEEIINWIKQMLDNPLFMEYS